MKNKKIAMIGLAAVMAVAAMSASAFAEERTSGDMPTCNVNESCEPAYYPVPQTAISGVGSCIKCFFYNCQCKIFKSMGDQLKGYITVRRGSYPMSVR